MDEFAIRLLQSIDLLLSGHPRSLQYLVSMFSDDSLWMSTIGKIESAESKVYLPSVLNSILEDLLSPRALLTPTSLDLSVLNESLKFGIQDSVDFRRLLRSGSIMVIPESKFISSFRTTIPLLSFFPILMSVERSENTDPAVFAASLLFGSVLDSDTYSIGQLFERAVALTIVCYSLLSNTHIMVAGAWLGCPGYMRSRLPVKAPKLSTRVAETINDMMIAEGGVFVNELVVAFNGCPGFDSMVTLTTTTTLAHSIYLEQKIAAVEDPESMRVSKIVHVLKFHF